MNILCLDFGLKRIGVAVGSTQMGIAFPRDVVNNDSVGLEELGTLMRAEIIDHVLVGRPLKRDNAVGDIEERLQGFVHWLKNEFGLPVEFIDERYTSKIAQAKLHEIGMKVKEQKQISDSTAAQVMLQEWLDAQA